MDLQAQGLLGDLVFHQLLVDLDIVLGGLVLLKSLWVPSPLEGLSSNLYLQQMGLGAPWGQGLQARLDFLVPHEPLGILGHLWHLLPGMDGASRQGVLGGLALHVLPWALGVRWDLGNHLHLCFLSVRRLLFLHQGQENPVLLGIP